MRACVREETCRHAPVSAEAPEEAGDTRDLPVETQVHLRRTCPLTPIPCQGSGSVRPRRSGGCSGHEVHAQTADI